jgi:nucleoside-diphosphate-sugar epimerase
MKHNVLVVGGAGYVGAVLVPKLLKAGHKVKVLDLFLYGMDLCEGAEKIKADVRDLAAVEKAVQGVDTVIHLACISNDPSFELDPELGKQINFDCFEPLVQAAKKAGVKRFIYASSSSVYGVSEIPNVDESHPLKPLTDYSKFKMMCEKVLPKYQSDDFTVLILRPATVCGYSPRLRLDLTVNILTSHAIANGKITVFGGAQKRPNIHIEDMADLYINCLDYPKEKIQGKIFNAGYQNKTVAEIAELVRGVVQKEVPSRPKVEIVTSPSNDNRSYHITSDKITKELGFKPRRTIEDAVLSLVNAFKEGRIKDVGDIKYYNIKTMQAAGLK